MQPIDLQLVRISLLNRYYYKFNYLEVYLVDNIEIEIITQSLRSELMQVLIPINLN